MRTHGTLAKWNEDRGFGFITIRHCPDTQMDGNNDGVPCEQQWCN